MTANLIHVNTEPAMTEWIATHAHVKQDLRGKSATKVRKNVQTVELIFILIHKQCQ